MNILKVLTDKRIKGNIGEDAAARYLKRRLFRILERNYVANGHEVDIIATNRRYLCFVEVKTRTVSEGAASYQRPAAAVTTEKMRSLISVARSYLYANPTKKMVRFDVAEIYLAKDKSVTDINYIEGAFTRDDASTGRK